MKTYCLGDVHGAHLALEQVLQRADFDYEEDVLIALGDVCDGWSGVAECFEILLKCKNLIYIEGNHDQWFLDYANKQMSKESQRHWFKYGGKMTVASYEKNPQLFDKHVTLLKNAKKYYVDEKNRCFVHAGIPNHHESLDKQVDYCWSRHFFDNARTWNHQNFKVHVAIQSIDPSQVVSEWFVGHTVVSEFKRTHNEAFINKPVKYSNITFCDTGAAYDGVLSLLNVDDGTLYQSDIVMKMYPDETGRNHFSYNTK